MSRSLTIPGLANARDLGGLERSDGSVSPTAVFIRAERLNRLDTAGWKALEDYGVRTVIDLRRPEEAIDAVPESVQHLFVDLDGDDADFWREYEADGRWGTPLYYLAHLSELPHRIGAVLEAVRSAEPGTVLFHCSAGWDRTGLVSAFLLRAIGVTEDAATSDYLASFANSVAMESLHERSFEVAERHAILERFGHSPESAFREMYRELDVASWFAAARTDATTRSEIESWRGAASPLQDGRR